MENHRFVKYFTILLGGMLFLGIPLFLLAYSDETTHPALTDEIVDHFNRFYPERALSVSQKGLVKLGSIEEDKKTRWLHHFYDPVYNRGLVLKGSLSTEELGLAFVAGGAKSKWESSKEWAENTLLQSGQKYSPTAGIFTDLFISDDDYSWERAIYDYAWKDKERGLRGLGHILHLLEDKTVPDHTRNDPHPHIIELFSITNASPYEIWTKKFTPDNLTLRINEPPIILGSLNGYFDSMAGYSNGNFFSKDTTPDKSKEYSVPLLGNISSERQSDGSISKFVYDSNNYYKLALLKLDAITNKKEYFLEDGGHLVLTDYWSRLSKQAVLHGAGAVKLFFDEVEKEKETKTLYNKNRSWLTKTTEKVVDGVKKASEKAIDGAKSATGKVIDGVKSAFGSVSTGMIGAYGGLAGVFFGGEESVTTEEQNTRGTEPEPQEETRSPTPLPTTQTPAPSSLARTDTGDNQPRTSVIPIASPPPSQNTSPFLPIAGVGGAPPQESPTAEETISALSPEITGTGTTTASTTTSTSETASTTATTTPPTTESVSIAPPIIIEPGAGTSTFATTTLSFIGTAEPNRIIQETTTSASTTSDTDGVWMLTFFSLPEGTTTLTFFASDAGGNISSGTPRTIFIYAPEATSSPSDTTPPSELAGPMPGPAIGDIAEIPILFSPRSLVITDDGAKALIVDGNRLSELELASGRVRTVTSGLKDPTRIAIEASGETALLLESRGSEFAHDFAGRLIRVNLLTGGKTILATGLNAPYGIAIEREDETALVRAGSGIYRMNLLTGSSTLIAPAYTNGDIAIDASGRYAFFLTEELFQGIGVIKKIDLTTNEVTTVAGPLAGSIRGNAIEISPDGTFALVIVAVGDSGIKKVDLVTGEESYVFPLGAALFGSYGIFDIAMSPDASEVFAWWIAPDDGLKLNKISIATREGTTIARARRPRALAITQDKSSVITANQAYFGWYFDKVELASGIGTRLAGFAENALSFALFPNDAEIVTTDASHSGVYSISRMNLSTGERSTVVTNLPSQAAQIIIEASNETALVLTTEKLLRVNLATGEITVLIDGIDGAGQVAIEKSGRSALLALTKGATAKLLRVGLTSSTTAEHIATRDTSAGPIGIGIDPEGENAVIAFTNEIIQVNLQTGEQTTILSMLCEEASIRAMALESTGKTALVSHDTCGLVRVRVK